MRTLLWEGQTSFGDDRATLNYDRRWRPSAPSTDGEHIGRVYRPVTARPDLFLFPRPKSTLKGQSFASAEAAIAKVDRGLRTNRENERCVI
jgi:hypothetical protein